MGRRSFSLTRGFHKKVKPADWPERHHMCSNPDCMFPNPPKSVSGRYDCLGYPQPGVHCFGVFDVSERKAERNDRIEKSQKREMYSKEKVRVQHYNAKFFRQFDEPQPEFPRQHERPRPVPRPAEAAEPLVLPSMLDSTSDNQSVFMRSLSPTRRAPRPPEDDGRVTPASSSTSCTSDLSRSCSPIMRGRSTDARPLADGVRPLRIDKDSIRSKAAAATTPAHHKTSSRQPATHGRDTPSSSRSPSGSLEAQREFHMHRAMSPPPAPGAPIKVEGLQFMTTSRQLPTARTVYGHKHGVVPDTYSSTPTPARPPREAAAPRPATSSAARHGAAFSHWNSSSMRGSPHATTSRNPTSGRSARPEADNPPRAVASPRHASPAATSRPSASTSRTDANGTFRRRVEVAKPLPPLPPGHKVSSSDPTPMRPQSPTPRTRNVRPMSPERFASKPLTGGLQYKYY
ncbi:uncharacterized protein SCHCODRAFT_02579805 [Schizophyllum commune H4-8]|uniref:uncharacterized protein n=1 Tax=Schizophyllum commune (strain H4-8 / FGSC 9210) TaxID=578458 RepID=UPI00215DF45C|nr:uncharacterized protein SCHCODRAFT_02579805 [Schizophyllum commune H4-8]KAI5892907.1 hypothetical protein SCHCODRAFT_02579805 [Schizophyllum commune H4-8]